MFESLLIITGSGEFRAATGVDGAGSQKAQERESPKGGLAPGGEMRDQAEGGDCAGHGETKSQRAINPAMANQGGPGSGLSRVRGETVVVVRGNAGER